MSRILLTDAEQLRSNLRGVGFQVAAVLVGPSGGVTLALENPATEAHEVIILPREQAEVLVEQLTTTLRCNAPDPYAPAAERYRGWLERRQAEGYATQAIDRPDEHERCTGSRAVG
ncbi:hypothetical protein [Deinococcus altitudinis]|uniref:hypothetical protein n=1 Tax=Deinococcus altitudinis TaxID=468914 RepID=UPI0038922261